MDLSPGVSVSGADLYAGLCIEGCLSFWRKFGAGGRWSPSVYSLLQELSEQLGKGTGWTWSAHAMGYNFYGLFCYYLCSPFSFLILLFMKFMYVNEAVTAVILIKAGLCSVSMAWYSGKKYPGRGSMAVSLGCMYALSDFFIGYYSNVMWLDCIMLLPVLAYLIEQLVHTGKWRGYCLVLGYCILTSYYMGFMLCTFAAFLLSGRAGCGRIRSTAGENPFFIIEICRGVCCRSRTCRNHTDPRNCCGIQNCSGGRGRHRTFGSVRRYLETAGRIIRGFPVLCKIRRPGRCEPLLWLCSAAFCRNLFSE